MPGSQVCAMPPELAKHALPAALHAIDVSRFAEVEPRDLILNPGQLKIDTFAAGRAIIYARLGDQASYDAIGFRTFAATPRKGPLPLQTSAWSDMQRRLSDQKKSHSVVDEILTHQAKLRHRPLELPKGGREDNYGHLEQCRFEA
jgi:hypothetical protein